MTIRFAEPRDIPGMTALLYQVGGVHHDIRPDIFRAGALKYDESALEEILKDPTRPIFIAEEADTVLGYCFCIHRDYDGSGVSTCRKELYIDDLCVDESCRGRHVGKALYDHTCAYAREKGCAFITLNVWCGNENAMAFYRNRGLTPRNITMEMKLC